MSDLRAAVEGLTSWPGVVREWPDRGRLGPPEHVVAVSLVDVLALIDGAQATFRAEFQKQEFGMRTADLVYDEVADEWGMTLDAILYLIGDPT